MAVLDAAEGHEALLAELSDVVVGSLLASHRVSKLAHWHLPNRPFQAHV